jgi:tyrosine-protein phosphatase YwqE
MKTDYHCHILPGLDDGAKDLDEAAFLARKLVAWGYGKAICTPHSSYLYHNTPSTVLSAFTELQNSLKKNNINLELFPSMEYRIIPEVWPEFCKNRSLLSPWEGNHILIEFPIRGYEFFGELDPIEEINKLISDGYKPVLAHPERYHYMGLTEYDRLLGIGCEFQMNIASIHGFYDEETKQRAIDMKNRGWYKFEGTDLHNKRYADFYDNILLNQ